MSQRLAEPVPKAARSKWRPPLSLVVAAVLVIMLLVPFAGVGFFRVYENQLIEATEAELIAQSAALAAVAAGKLRQEGGNDLPLGAGALPEPRIADDRRVGAGVRRDWSPVLPRLDLTTTAILPDRPAARPADHPVSPVHLAAGRDLDAILRDTQKATLAGFRLLDPNGTVIAGRAETGLSLSHVPEVARALSGHYASALRRRVVSNPQPIYSLSRGTSVRVFIALPVIVRDRVAGVIYASRTPSNILRELYLKRETVAFVAAFTLAATFVVGLIFLRAIAGPIRALTRRSLRIGAGDRAALEPLAIHGNREVHALSESMLDMSRRLFERNDYISTFANHVTHELKSPLTAIQGAAELLRDGGEDLSVAERTRFLDNILSDTERASLLLNRLRELARADSVEGGGSCRLSAVADAIGVRFPELEIICPRDGVLPLSMEKADIVFGNLADNSLGHGAARVEILAEVSERVLTILVKDDGEGISAGNACQVFEIFFTTRRERGGTGMGLGIAEALLKAHGGAIRLLSGEGGACFELKLPLPAGAD